MATHIPIGTPTPAPTWHIPTAGTDPEKLKSILKDQNTSTEQFAHVLGRLQELYGLRVQDKTATDEEKQLFEMLNKLVSGTISASDTQKLGSMLGLNQEKLAEAQAGFVRHDPSSIR